VIGRFEKMLLVLATALTGGTGILYAWTRYLVRSTDPFAVINHTWQPALQHAHVLCAPLLLFALGMIARMHILGRYRDPRARRGRRMGILASLLIAPMAVSGYLIQVLASSTPRAIAGWLHLGTGLLFLLSISFHFAAALSPRTDGRADLSEAKWQGYAGARSLWRVLLVPARYVRLQEARFFSRGAWIKEASTEPTSSEPTTARDHPMEMG